MCYYFTWLHKYNIGEYDIVDYKHNSENEIKLKPSYKGHILFLWRCLQYLEEFQRYGYKPKVIKGKKVIKNWNNSVSTLIDIAGVFFPRVDWRSVVNPINKS